ncbi:MAG: hypothetical protein Q8R29_02040 [bacterium]|nr:hypothetical protein [bacterium]
MAEETLRKVGSAVLKAFWKGNGAQIEPLPPPPLSATVAPQQPAPTNRAASYAARKTPAVTRISSLGQQTATAPVQQQIDPECDALIRQALAETDTPGVEEFMAQLDVLREDVPDESKRINIALKTVARTHQLTAEKLLEGLKQRLQVLDREDQEYASFLQAQEQQTIGTTAQQVQTLEQQVAEKDIQLTALQQEKDALIQQLEVVSGQVEEVRERNRIAAEEFRVTCDFHRRDLTTIVSKMESRLATSPAPTTTTQA